MKITRVKSLPISEPGIYRGIELSDYHSAAIVPSGEFSVSSSDLRRAWSMSMAHFHDAWVHNPDRAEVKTTPAMVFGAAAHHLLLGEERFSTSYVQEPLEYRDLGTAKVRPWNNNATECREWHAKQKRAGRIALKYEHYERLRGMGRALALEPLVQNGILEGAIESTGIVKDKDTGLWIKVRPDVIPTKSGDFVDLKTIADISDRGIKRRMAESGYHMQAGLIWLWADQMGLPFETFTLAFAESDRPFCVRMVPVSEVDLSLGLNQCRAMLKVIARCLDSGVWPGPGAGELRELTLPQAEREAITKRLQYEGMD
jgi:hypothetical protein